jgi:Na+/melibiose symporter-like transporter
VLSDDDLQLLGATHARATAVEAAVAVVAAGGDGGPAVAALATALVAAAAAVLDRPAKSSLLFAGGALATLLFIAVPVGPAGTIWLAAVQVLMILVYAGFPVAAPAVLADVIDYGRLRFGVDYAGTYFAIYNVMYKAVPGFGAAQSRVSSFHTQSSVISTVSSETIAL